MRKKAMLILMLAAAAALLLSCAATPAKQISDEELMAAIEGSQEFYELKELNEKLNEEFLGIDLSGAADCLIKLDGTRATAEQIVVITAKDASSAKTLEEELQTYLVNVMEAYRDYQPDEVPKIENAILRSNGLQLALIISTDSALASDALDAAWK